MQTLIDELSEVSRDSLRRDFQRVESTTWVTELARQKQWRKANEAFLNHERERGREEMQHLMAELNIKRPVQPCVAADLVTAAVSLYVAEGDLESSVERVSPDCLMIRIHNCPVFRQLEANHWRGVTACGSWHRRRGWYDALGIQPIDSVVSESKWGDEACESLIDFG